MFVLDLAWISFSKLLFFSFLFFRGGFYAFGRSSWFEVRYVVLGFRTGIQEEKRREGKRRRRTLETCVRCGLMATLTLTVGLMGLSVLRHVKSVYFCGLFGASGSRLGVVRLGLRLLGLRVSCWRCRRSIWSFGRWFFGIGDFGVFGLGWMAWFALFGELVGFGWIGQDKTKWVRL